MGAPAEDVEQQPTTSPAETNETSDAPTLVEVIEKIGFGYCHVKTGLCGGGVWLADGTELLLISSVGNEVARQWGMSAFQKGFIVTAAYLGIFIGNCCSGPCGDAFGRRTMILVSYVGIFLFGVLSSYSVDFFTLTASRIVVGSFIGMGQPAWNALGAEVSPAWWRMATNACSQALFPLGEVYAAVLLTADDPTLMNLHWRELLRLGALPALILLFFGYFFLRESPSFLAMKGRTEEAKAVLKGMNADNVWAGVGDEIDVTCQMPVPSVTTDSRYEAFQRQLKIVFGRELWFSTLNVMYTCFCLNLAYYGALYAFPQVLSQVLTSSSASSELVIGALWEIVGQILAFTVGLSLPRRKAIKFYLGMSVASLILFCIGADASDDDLFVEAILKCGYYGTKIFVSMGFIIVYQYATEIYPTSARVTGSSLNMAAGRLAAMLAPIVYELLMEATGSFLPFFLGIALFLTLNIMFVDWLRETAGVALKDHLDHEDEAPSPIKEKTTGYDATAKQD